MSIPNKLIQSQNKLLYLRLFYLIKQAKAHIQLQNGVNA